MAIFGNSALQQLWVDEQIFSGQLDLVAQPTHDLHCLLWSSRRNHFTWIVEALDLPLRLSQLWI